MPTYTHNHTANSTTESGFVLILAMVMLLLISSIGIWALRTSDSELQVAGNAQQVETQFNVTEGGAYAESLKVGFFIQPFYQISNPNLPNQLLIPLTDLDTGTGDFDPGAKTTATLVKLQEYKDDPTKGLAPVDTWPWENLQPDYANNDLDYRYLVTYLHSDTAPIGYDANSFAGYKFKIMSSAAQLPLTVEVGGTKIGPKI